MKGWSQRAAGWRRVLRGEAGAAMVVALLTVVVMLLLTAALVVASLAETFNAQTAEDSARAFLVADAAAAHAIAALRRDSDWSDADPVRCGSALYDPDRRECMVDIPYPRAGAIIVSPAPGGGQEPGCAAKPVSGPGTPTADLPAERSFGRYTVTVLERVNPDTIRLRVVGRVGRAARGYEFTVERVTPADFVSYSSLRVDATRVGNGTFRIHGSVYVRGDWEFKGTSEQLNDRPISEGDIQDPVYDNQTFVCNNLVLQGNAQIGMPRTPMLGVHIAGEQVNRGGAVEIHSLLQDATVPDIRLASIAKAVQCIRGLLDRASCLAEGFGDLWDAYSNELSGNQMVVLQGTAWQTQRTQDLSLGSRRWRIPKRGRVNECANNSLSLAEVLGPCAAYYDGSGRLYVAAGQVIYVPGRLSVEQDVDYRVDNDPSRGCQPGAPDDPCRPDDAAMFVVACEAGTSCNLTLNSPAYGLDVQEMLRAQRRASNGLFYPGTTFPTRDLLAILVHGKVRFGLQGNLANQEVNAVVISGCDRSLAADRCDLTMQKNLQLYGSVISRSLVFEQNVDLFQVPDLRRYLPFSVDRFLSAPGGAGVVVTRWREIGF